MLTVRKDSTREILDIDISADGVKVEGPMMIDSDWSCAKGVKGYE